MRSHSLAVLAVFVAVAAPARAAITSSNITAPADGTHYLVTDADPEHDVPVTGTSNGTTGDSVDIRCYTRSDDWSGATNTIPVAADGSFSGTISTGDPYGSCVLRAVPHNFPATSDPSPFTGPTLLGEWNLSYTISGGPNDGKVYNYYVLFQGPNAMNDYVSASEGGLWDSRLQYDPTHASAYVWYENGALESNEELASNNRSTLQVDGFNAYAPYAARGLFPNNEGLPALTYDASRDAATGNTTIHETDPIVVCPAETPFPPTAISCPKFISAGVRLDRSIFTDDGGRQVHIVDTWRGTDDKSHTISPHYLQYVSGYAPDGGNVTPGFKFPWIGDFATFTSETTFAGPGPGAGSVFVRSNNAAPDGSEAYPVGAISFDLAPNDVRWSSRRSFYLRDENVAVPAGGTAVVRQDFVLGQTLAEVERKAGANVDRFFAPTVSITSPANGSTVTGATSTKQVTVTGTASDNAGIASLTLNGAPGSVANGAFSAPVTLTLGSNTLTVVARDAAGNATTAAATVSYADNVAPSVTGFTASPRTFRVGAGATPVTARAAKGTKFKLTLSEDAKVAIAIAQVKPGKHKRLVPRGTLRRSLKAGKRTVKFSGRIGTRKLKPGRYVATVTATDASGNKSKKKTVKLRVVQR
jgi:hypothetical protein